MSHILDTGASTNSEKVENIAKTSLVMLGAIGAATLAAHKFWPKGITYGDKEDWEHEDKSKKEKVKDKVKDVKAAVTGEPRRDERGEGGSGSGSGSGGRDDDRRDDRRNDRRDDRRGSGGGGRGGRDRDRSRERRERYLEERERYGRPNIARDGIAPGRLVLPAAAAGARAAKEYHDDRKSRRRDEDDRPPPPPPPGPRDRDRYDDYDPREWRDRYAEGVGPPPPPPPTIPATQRRVERVEKQQYTSTAGPPPPPPAAPNPPSVAASYSRADPAPAPVVISTGDRGGSTGIRMAPRDPPLGRYYVDRDTIVIPSRGETEFVVNRTGPPGSRLTTVEREGRIYR